MIGYDEGTIMVKLGREVPVASMDNSGKIIWAKHNEIQTVNIKSVGADYEVWALLQIDSFSLLPDTPHVVDIVLCLLRLLGYWRREIAFGRQGVGHVRSLPSSEAFFQYLFSLVVLIISMKLL